ncbi:MAG: SAM-dependent methyltransferase [Bacteroidota bacterium]
MRLYLIPSFLAPDTFDTLSSEITTVIERLDTFLVEHPKTARRFMRKLSRTKDLDAISLFVLNKKTEIQELHQFLERLPETTEEIGIISEAGCPGVADPGAKAVAYAHKKEWDVIPLVGPSSILLALMGSGFSGQKFAFHGYLPIKSPERKAELKRLEKESRQQRQTQIFMETPYRNNAFLEDLMKTLQPQTRLCIAADLTAPTAFLQTHSIQDWKNKLPDLHKRPTIFLIFA